jgi:DMSO/TMAO reductase YedYZ molybdopterin-dependent catalytic subunit
MREQPTVTKRTFRDLILVAALVAAVALSAVACGSSSQTTTSASVGSTEIGTSGSIVFSGLIDYPMTFTALDMDYMDWVTIAADDPELGSTKYEGVHLSDIFSYVGVQADAKTVVITAADGSTSEVTIADVSSDALLAVADDNTLSTVMPGMASAAWVKDVVKMTFK